MASAKYTRPAKRRPKLSAARYDEPPTGSQYRQGIRDAQKFNRQQRKRNQFRTVPKDRPSVV